MLAIFNFRITNPEQVKSGISLINGTFISTLSGPMVYGTCYSPLSKKEELKDLGFAGDKLCYMTRL